MTRPALLLLLLVGCPGPAVVVAPQPLPAPQAQPQPVDARGTLVVALSSGHPDRVWAILGPGPRAEFGDEAAFRRWCKRYCADWLVSILAAPDEPTSTATYSLIGADKAPHAVPIRVRERDGQHEVVDGPFLPSPRDPKTVLAALGTALLRLGNDPTFDTAQRKAWLRLAAGVTAALAARPVQIVSGVPLAVDGGTVELVESGGAWSIRRFTTTPAPAP